MLHLYYTNLETNELKRKFIAEAQEKCRVGYPIIRSWIARPDSTTHRNPKPVYRPILAEITGIKEEKLFRNQ